MQIFHIALESQWREAQRTGVYTGSTLGRSLAEEGFIHAARPDQVKRVSDAYYAGVRQPLVRLEIDTDQLRSEWREDPVGNDTYPHIYGPLNVEAVTAARPWHRSGREKSFLEVFLSEAMTRIFLAIGAMLLAVLGSAVGRSVGEEHGALAGALMGLGLGALVFFLARRRRR